MFANNEIGTIEPVKEIGKICRERKVIFHTDAVQAVGNVKIDVKDMNIDLLSLAGHKVYGPKGIGALYIRKGIRIDNLIHGGGQERARRAGTENIPAIVGLGKAMEIAGENLDEHIAKISKLRDKLIKGLLEVPFTRLNGPKDGSKRLPGNVNVCFEFIEGEGILLSLDFEGILWFKWKCLYIRIIRSITRVISNRFTSWNSTRIIKIKFRWRDNWRRRWLRIRKSTTNNRKIKKYVTIMEKSFNRSRRRELIMIYSEKVMDHFKTQEM